MGISSELLLLLLLPYLRANLCVFDDFHEKEEEGEEESWDERESIEENLQLLSAIYESGGIGP